MNTGTGSGDRAWSPAQGTADPLRQAAEQVTDQAGQAAEQVVEGARQAVSTGVSGGKDWMTGNLTAVASGLRQALTGLEEDGHGFAASLLDRVAGRVEDAAGYLEHREIDDLRWELEGFARRQPGVFLAAAFALGMAGARFLKSSRPQPERYLGGGPGAGGYAGGYTPGYPAGYTPGYGTGYSPAYVPPTTPPYSYSAGAASPHDTTRGGSDLAHDLDPIGAAALRDGLPETEATAPPPHIAGGREGLFNPATGTSRPVMGAGTEGDLPGSITPATE